MIPCTLLGGSAAQPVSDRRAASLMDPDHFEARIPEVTDRQQWEARKNELREIALNSAGLWPPLPKTPLNPRVFDEKRGNGFRVAKVYFESLPGFLATGNLYRPEAGSGPFPAVLSAHGHWQYGRLNNEEGGSVPGRAIDLARMGFVLLSIDMVGYNDSLQLPHDRVKSRAQLKADQPLPYEARLFRPDFAFPRAELYGLSLAGLQLWNGIRAIDFLVSLPEVDAQRIGVTGASGGATQTLLLMAVDDRIQAAAPVNIIGATKHPGCRCENPRGLWRHTSTIELSATFAPKPLLLPSATEDPWTHSFPERELPIFKKYYALYGAEDQVANVHVTAGHNYNAETRAAVYAWFARHLKSPNPPITDPDGVTQELKQLGDLRVFPEHILPEQALSGQEVIENWIAQSEKDLQAALPASPADLPEFVSTFGKRLAQIQDVATGLAFARARWPKDPLTLVGLGRCGLLAALGGAVSGEADRVVVDLAGRNPGLDAELLELLPVASLRRAGDLRTAALLLMRKPLELVNPGASFDRTWYRERAAAVGLSQNLRFRESTSIWPPDRFLVSDKRSQFDR
ncbi:MAG: hypothetical protein GEV06_08000 [Luteitalea sp.]|nr:hypothetical protein [Luteitalea sp.]